MAFRYQRNCRAYKNIVPIWISSWPALGVNSHEFTPTSVRCSNFEALNFLDHYCSVALLLRIESDSRNEFCSNLRTEQ